MKAALSAENVRSPDTRVVKKNPIIPKSRPLSAIGKNYFWENGKKGKREELFLGKSGKREWDFARENGKKGF